MPDFQDGPRSYHFAEAVQTLCPPWLAGNFGYRFMFSLAIQLDALGEYLRLGIRQRMPGQAQPEALQYIGQDRQIRRGLNEPDAGYADRLRKAFQTWKLAGSPLAVLGQLASYYIGETVPVFRYVVNGLDENGTRITDYWTLDNGNFSYHRANPSNWNWDGTYPVGRFWIIIYDSILTPWTVGDGHTVGGGQSVGFTESGQFITDLRGLIDVWKAAGSHAGTFDSGCDAGIILAGTTTEDPVKVNGFVVGDGTVVGMTTVVGLFDPSLPPGTPMPNGNWNDPANRDSSAFYANGT